jgi:hypothetical protein
MLELETTALWISFGSARSLSTLEFLVLAEFSVLATTSLSGFAVPRMTTKANRVPGSD